MSYNGFASLGWRHRVVLRGSSVNVTSPLSRSCGGVILGQRNRKGRS